MADLGQRDVAFAPCYKILMIVSLFCPLQIVIKWRRTLRGWGTAYVLWATFFKKKRISEVFLVAHNIFIKKMQFIRKKIGGGSRNRTWEHWSDRNSSTCSRKKRGNFGMRLKLSALWYQRNRPLKCASAQFDTWRELIKRFAFAYTRNA